MEQARLHLDNRFIGEGHGYGTLAPRTVNRMDTTVHRPDFVSSGPGHNALHGLMWANSSQECLLLNYSNFHFFSIFVPEKILTASLRGQGGTKKRRAIGSIEIGSVTTAWTFLMPGGLTETDGGLERNEVEGVPVRGAFMC